jgi:geranylgeranyl reductase family protein
MPDLEADVAVVGSGPAGATAAHRLARRGLRTVLLDRAKLPRYKTCGGGVVRRAASLIPIDVGPAVERDCFVAELHDHDAEVELRVRREEPLVRMTMRDKLDWALALAARDAGAALLHPCEVRTLTQTPEAVELQTSEGTLRARFVVGADGATGPVARQGGWTDTPPTIPALEWELDVPASAIDRYAEAARFDLGCPEQGYAWVFPKRDHLSVGILKVGENRGGLKERLETYIRGLDLGPIASVERHGYVIPLYPRRGGFGRGRLLLVGDAAGLADPVTCEGISHAVLSGRLAARAIEIGGLERPERVRSMYRRQLDREVLPELRIARLLSRLVYRHTRLRQRLIGLFGRPFAEAIAEVIAGARSYKELLSSPRNYVQMLRADADWIERALETLKLRPAEPLDRWRHESE